MQELSAFKHINLLKCCDTGSQTTQFGLPRVKAWVHRGCEVPNPIVINSSSTKNMPGCFQCLFVPTVHQLQTKQTGLRDSGPRSTYSHCSARGIKPINQWSNPITALWGPEGSGRLRRPDSVRWALEGCQPDTPVVFTPRNFLVLILEVGSTPGTWNCRMPWKKSTLTLPGIDPGTFQLVM
jgi:hypothetical protein